MLASRAMILFILQPHATIPLSLYDASIKWTLSLSPPYFTPHFDAWRAGILGHTHFPWHIFKPPFSADKRAVILYFAFCINALSAGPLPLIICLVIMLILIAVYIDIYVLPALR